MFVDAIEKVEQFTRPIHIIRRYYNSTAVSPITATLFFVNEEGYAVTCRHVLDLVLQTDVINKRYADFKTERSKLSRTEKYNKRLKELEKRYGYDGASPVQQLTRFIRCVDESAGFNYWAHPQYDLAILHFVKAPKLLCQSFAVFLKDGSKARQGRSLCRLGFPFPEFTNFRYDETSDTLAWTAEGRVNTPRFPLDGMITRHILEDNRVTGIELSTPGLIGQSGGPLFDKDAIVYGMQCKTVHLHLGFDMKNLEVREGPATTRVSNYPFLHVGRCIHVDVIKDFLREQSVKFYEG